MASISVLAPGATSWPAGLLQRCAEGDEAAWSRLYEEYEPSARRFLLRMGVEALVVDDTCQEVFLQAFRFLPGFRGECSFKTWLYRICMSEARRSRHRLRLSRLLSTAMSRQSIESSGELGDERSSRLVQRALAALKENERAVFVLYELEGQAGKDIAAIIDCPEATVWRRLHYARKSFRSFIADHGVSQ